MTSTNLALVFGTTLLKKGKVAKTESRKIKLGMDHYVASVNVVRAMIDNWDILFQVSGVVKYTYFIYSSSVHRIGESSVWITKSSILEIPSTFAYHITFGPEHLIKMSKNEKEYAVKVTIFTSRCPPIFRSRLLSVCGSSALKPWILSDAGIWGRFSECGFNF